MNMWIVRRFLISHTETTQVGSLNIRNDSRKLWTDSGQDGQMNTLQHSEGDTIYEPSSEPPKTPSSPSDAGICDAGARNKDI